MPLALLDKPTNRLLCLATGIRMANRPATVENRESFPVTMIDFTPIPRRTGDMILTVIATTLGTHSTNTSSLRRDTISRFTSVKKVTYKLGRRVCRNATHFLFRLYLVSIVEHACVWLSDELQKVGGNTKKLIKDIRKRL